MIKYLIFRNILLFFEFKVICFIRKSVSEEIKTFIKSKKSKKKKKKKKKKMIAYKLNILLKKKYNEEEINEITKLYRKLKGLEIGSH